MLTAFFQRASASQASRKARSVFLVAVKCYSKQKRWINIKDLLVCATNVEDTVQELVIQVQIQFLFCAKVSKT